MAGMKGLLSLKIEDLESLYKSYMPYIERGGLFLPTQKSYEMGDDVFIKLKLPGETSVLPAAGKVIWVTPRRAQNRRVTGIGVQFADSTVHTRIETFLAGALESGKSTHTM